MLNNTVIQNFINEEIGLACYTFDHEAMKELSDIVTGFLDYNPDFPTLYDYALDCENKWEIIVCYGGSLNAFRNKSANGFTKEHEVLTAEEMLEEIIGTSIQVSEEEIERIFQ